MKISAYIPDQPALSPRQVDEFLQLRDAILHDTLAEYTAFRDRKDRTGDDYYCRSQLPTAWSSAVDENSPLGGGGHGHADVEDEDPADGYGHHQAEASMLSGVDRQQWKLMRRHHKLAVFKERNGGSSICNSNSKAPSQHSRGVELRTPGDAPNEKLATKTCVSRLLTVGSVRGKLDDAMYGGFVRNDHDFRLRSSYAKDDLDDVKFLHEFESPTLDDPFRFCGISWIAIGKKPVPFIKQRDTVVLLSSGLVETENGERVGFVVMHSVRLPGLYGFEQLNLVRAYGSMCILKRQRDANNVELYGSGFFAPMGELPERVVMQSIAKSMLSSAQTIETSFTKKLFWLVQRSNSKSQQRRRLRSRAGAGDQEGQEEYEYEQGEEEDDDDVECVGGCPPKRFLSALRSRRGRCMVCRKPLCGSCSVSRNITLEVSRGGGARQKPLAFCLFCLDKAKRTSATVIATRELLLGSRKTRNTTTATAAATTHPTNATSGRGRGISKALTAQQLERELLDSFRSESTRSPGSSSNE